MARTHQSSEAVFKSTLPEDIDWRPFLPFPPSVRLAVVARKAESLLPWMHRDTKHRRGITHGGSLKNRLECSDAVCKA
jgi:hypothetical protein